MTAMEQRIATTATDLPFAPERVERHSLREVLGAAAWQRLPEAVRARFSETAPDVTYAGAFEVVNASAIGRFFAWLGALVGTPVVPRTGSHVAARVDVRATRDGVEWRREYEWEGGGRSVVTSTKLVRDGELIERLPARLNMPLDVREEKGVLVFESRGYYFDFRFGGLGFRLPLPAFFSPGLTRVEHIDLGHGWFRFTLIVKHPWFGEMFFQTGRFCAMEDET
jgi:hypothetical protein